MQTEIIFINHLSIPLCHFVNVRGHINRPQRCCLVRYIRIEIESRISGDDHPEPVSFMRRIKHCYFPPSFTCLLHPYFRYFQRAFISSTNARFIKWFLQETYRTRRFQILLREFKIFIGRNKNNRGFENRYLLSFCCQRKTILFRPCAHPETRHPGGVFLKQHSKIQPPRQMSAPTNPNVSKSKLSARHTDSSSSTM